MSRYKEPNYSVEELDQRTDLAKYKGYYISKSGEIYNRFGHKMRPYMNHSGAWVVMLKINGKRVCPTVNRLIYEAFNPGVDLSNIRVSNVLGSDNSQFSLDNIVLTKTKPGGEIRNSKEYKRTYRKTKTEIITKRNELLKNKRKYKKEIKILNWVIGAENET